MIHGLGETRFTPAAGEKTRLLIGLGIALGAMYVLYRGALALAFVAAPLRGGVRGLGGARRVDRLDGPSNYYLEIKKG